jgi:hypothetical protein
VAQPARGEQTFTPVIQDVVSTPRWFRGVDGIVHVQYDLRLINGFTGVTPSMDAFGEAFATQTPVPFVTEGAGVYRNRTPVGVDILDLP